MVFLIANNLGWGNEIYEIDEEWVRDIKKNGKIEDLIIRELYFTVSGGFSKNCKNRAFTKKKITTKITLSQKKLYKNPTLCLSQKIFFQAHVFKKSIKNFYFSKSTFVATSEILKSQCFVVLMLVSKIFKKMKWNEKINSVI